jgi:hypothetical protein
MINAKISLVIWMDFYGIYVTERRKNASPTFLSFICLSWFSWQHFLSIEKVPRRGYRKNKSYKIVGFAQ